MSVLASVVSAAGLAFSLLRRKFASLGTRERSEKAALPVTFPFSPRRQGTQRCSCFSPHASHRQGEKPGRRKWSRGSGRWRGQLPTQLLRGEVSIVTPACGCHVTDAVRAGIKSDSLMGMSGFSASSMQRRNSSETANQAEAKTGCPAREGLTLSWSPWPCPLGAPHTAAHPWSTPAAHHGT